MDPATVAELRDTKALFDDGVLDESEYESKKRELLNTPPPAEAAPRQARRIATTAKGGENLLLYFCKGRACLDNRAAFFLAPHELHAVPCASATIKQALARIDYTFARGLVLPQPTAPWPHFPGLFRGKVIGGLFKHQLASLKAMRRLETATKQFGKLRGGVLADAPGLGKTVTVLALVLATAGELPTVPEAFWDARAIDESFAALIQSESELRRECLRGLRGLIAHRDRFVKASLAWAEADALLRATQPPFSFNSVAALEAHVKRGAARLRYATPAGRDDVKLDFAHAMALTRCRLDGRRRAALLGGAGRRALAERALKPTGGTLIVVPDALLEHWRAQIGRHVDLRRLAPSFGDGASGDGCCFVYGWGDAARWHPDFQRGSRERHPRLPSAQELRRFLVVVVPFSVCRDAAKRDRDWREARDRRVYRHGSTQDAASSPLLQLRWLRLVVDEGHELAGGDGDLAAETSTFISEVFAERRWVVSGTPTTGDVDDPAIVRNHLRQLQKLLQWLRHPRYGLDANPRLDARQDAADDARRRRAAFEGEVIAPFCDGQSEAARTTLVELLKTICVRHRKTDLTLPPPVYENYEVEVALKAGESVDADAYQWRVDEALADFVVRTKESVRSPKIAVFSQRDGDLASVAEALYARLHGGIAEFDVTRLGHQASARELVRFQTDKREVRKCPRCWRDNDVDQKSCTHALLEVRLLDDDDLARRRGDALHANLPDAQRVACGRRLLIEPERIVGLVAIRTMLPPATAQGYADDWRAWTVGDELLITLDAATFAPRRDAHAWRDWGCHACVDRAARQNYESADWFLGPLRPPGAITSGSVRVRLEKWARCGQWHGPRWYRGPKLEAQNVLVEREDVPILCLTRQASHGLDLSFLTHVVLLEPIRDSALLEQVVSRAHRVGATQSVRVATLQAFVAGFEKPEKTYICDHCYKSFAIEAVADLHMTKCSRNPDATDVPAWRRFTMSAVFDELRPPAAT